MSVRTIHGNPRAFSASAVLEQIGTALSAIKAEDGLTFSDLGALLGKSADQAAKYCDGTATMDAITFARAKREWNGRFTRGVDRLCVESRPCSDGDRTRQNKVLAAALALSIALEDDNEVSPAEVKNNRATLEAARDALDAVLRKVVKAA